MSQFKNIRRNPNRKRKRAGRPRVKPFSAMTPMGEALYCAELGLDKKNAEPMKKAERN